MPHLNHFSLTHAARSALGHYHGAGPFTLYLAVFIGGSIGTAVRALLTLVPLPWLMTANVLACLMVGCSTAFLMQKNCSRLYRQGVNAGFLGGLSTFAASVIEILLEGRESGNMAVLTAGLDLLALLSELAAYICAAIIGFMLMRLYLRHSREKTLTGS